MTKEPPNGMNRPRCDVDRTVRRVDLFGSVIVWSKVVEDLIERRRRPAWDGCSGADDDAGDKIVKQPEGATSINWQASIEKVTTPGVRRRQRSNVCSEIRIHLQHLRHHAPVPPTSAQP